MLSRGNFRFFDPKWRSSIQVSILNIYLLHKRMIYFKILYCELVEFWSLLTKKICNKFKPRAEIISAISTRTFCIATQLLLENYENEQLFCLFVSETN
jgi:hypothetical protein